jgi:hypothetical protein
MTPATCSDQSNRSSSAKVAGMTFSPVLTKKSVFLRISQFKSTGGKTYWQLAASQIPKRRFHSTRLPSSRKPGRRPGCAGSLPTSTTTCRGSAAASSRSSSTPTSPRLRLARRTPGRPRSCSARRARSRTSCGPSTLVSTASPLPSFRLIPFNRIRLLLRL